MSLFLKNSKLLYAKIIKNIKVCNIIHKKDHVIFQNLINYVIFYTEKENNEKAQTEFAPNFSIIEVSHCKMWPT